MDWKSNFDERELHEIDLCVMYNEQFGHGTLRHNLRVVVAKMVSILDNAQSLVNDEDEEVRKNVWDNDDMRETVPDNAQSLVNDEDEVIALEPGNYVYDDVSLPDGVHLRGAERTVPDTYISDDIAPLEGLLSCE